MNEIKNFRIGTLEDLSAVSEQILDSMEHALVLFIGTLGAGKTTMIKKLLELLGSSDIGSSPSYALINEYQTADNKVFHIDLYRLNSAEEAFQLGIEDYLYSGNYCFVEWPQIIMDYLEDPYHIINIEIMENNERKITLI
jgi:tRNA threonylcarbamoyladenosine biosynthesis protein TsaE